MSAAGQVLVMVVVVVVVLIRLHRGWRSSISYRSSRIAIGRRCYCGHPGIVIGHS